MPEGQMKRRKLPLKREGRCKHIVKSLGFEATCFEIFVVRVTIKTLTETGNCARQTSGTQGRCILNAEFKSYCSSASVLKSSSVF